MTSPSKDLRRRILEEAASHPAPTRAEHLRRTSAALVAGAACSLVGFAAIGGVGSLPPAFLALTGGGWALLAALATWLGFGRGGSMTGRPTAHLWLVAALAAPLVLAQALVGLWLVPMDGADPGDLLHHVKCLGFGVAFALGPLAAMLWIRRGTEAVHPRAGGAAPGAVAGAWGGLLIHLRCECAGAAHLALGHAMPIALLAVAGALVGSRWLALRPIAPR